MNKKIFCVILAVIISACVLTACENDNGVTIETPTATQKATRVYTDPDEANNETVTFVANTEWINNYILEYNYADTGTASQITEIRYGDTYKAIDSLNGLISYFEQVEGGIDEFVINTETNEGVHTFLADQDMDTLTTGFMRVSSLDGDFTTQSDVQYEGTEMVAGREADRYLKSVYTSDTLTAYAFVWVDKEYGFASKCAVYTVQGSLYSSWELTSFSVGTVSYEDAVLDISAYTITESSAESSAE